MNVKKIISLVAVVCVTVTSMAGCGVGKKDKNDEQVVLRWVMSGPGRQKDSEEVWEAVNKKIQDKLPNVTVEFEVIPGSEYQKKVLLMQAGKEKIDILNTYQLSLIEEVENGGIIEITDLLNKYGQGIKEQLPEWFFDYMRVDGGLYGIPSYQGLANERAFVTQKEYADKWLDTEGLKRELYSSNFITDGAVEIIEDYLQKLDENGKIQYGVHHYNEYPVKGYETVVSNFIVNNETHEIAYKFELPSMKEQYKRHAEWYSKGWIRKDALSATDESQKKGIAEGYVLFDNGYNRNLQENLSKKNGTELLVIPFADNYFIPMSSAAGGNSITASCDYPELAMQVLNLFQTDKEIYNTLVYGIEGKHYTKVDENRIETPYGAQGESTNDYGIYKWIVGNTQLAYLTQDAPDDFLDYEFNVINGSDYRSKLIGFVPTLDEVSDEIAQLNAIKGEYMKSLATGVLGEDWEAFYDEWMKKANAAGLQKVKEVLQSQVDEFLKNKN